MARDSIAFAIDSQVANAISAIAIVSGMPGATAPDQELRRERFAELVRSRFGGNKAEAARRLHLGTGPYVRQLMEGERPISEKTVAKIESANNGQLRGWFNPTFEGVATAPLAHDLSQARPIIPIRKITWESLMGADLSEPFELDVIDDALAPEIFKGCTMRLDPAANRPVREGWPALFRDAEGRHYLRDYEAGAGDSFNAVARARGFAPLGSVEHGLTVRAVMRGVDYP